ncbi:calcium/proton exchanger [Desulfobacca acetoxidans]|uniref:Ca(2+)/H(+) antiporter n=1 Tax=Desulfobacca acetoxidans (strain ATCC 700848 / DSM 11109 / ASRB2) TaxID=880072 RepID=F2NFT4_DESAR|nr:calcium/proton exchanger [Desulfobacca acetoxidans]AEB10203.1 calcium/proton antiporter, CaCA family [Desulfobacca acetoxidans DSM 11109]
MKILQKIFYGLTLFFIPLTIILDRIGGVPQPLLFFLAAVAIFPLAALLVHATEQLASYTGDTIGGLLNATFGNAPELIIALVALKAGLYDMVKASIIGAILANMLLGLGLAFLLGGYRRHTQNFNPVAARNFMTMMLLAVISLAVPSTFHNFVTADAIQHEQYVNLAVAVVLLATYGLSLFFMLQTHPDFFKSSAEDVEPPDEVRWSLPRAVAILLLTSVFVAFMSEILVGAVEETGRTLGMSQAFIGLVILAVVGGAAESSSAVAMGMKNRMDLSLSIAIGSSIQIALFVAPVLVLMSYFIAPQPLNLVFNRVLLGIIFLTVLIGAMVAGDGKANWFKGVQLITVYIILAIMFYFLPGS